MTPEQRARVEEIRMRQGGAFGHNDVRDLLSLVEELDRQLQAALAEDEDHSNWTCGPCGRVGIGIENLKRHIDSCDAFLRVMAHRSGVVVRTPPSTEQEKEG